MDRQARLFVDKQTNSLLSDCLSLHANEVYDTTIIIIFFLQNCEEEMGSIIFS